MKTMTNSDINAAKLATIFSLYRISKRNDQSSGDRKESLLIHSIRVTN
ncbi:conserved hypothetical protein [Trichinella spiralis]|nr:conserved hypothetical protein [Trichinella spiralis]